MSAHIITPGGRARFGRYLRLEERSPGTVENYLRAVESFERFLGGAAVTRERTMAWKEALVAGGLRPATVNAKLAAVNAFCVFSGWPECRVKALRLQRQVFRDESRQLTRREYERLLSCAGGRLSLLMQAVCATGIRVSEVRYLTVEAARRGRADIALKGKLRTILLPRLLCRKLLRYAGEKKIAFGAIFRTGGGRDLSRKQIWAEMKALAERAGVPPSKVFPHNLRHLFARAFYQACGDLVQLADVLGHSSVETTRLYLCSTGAEHARRLEKLHLLL